MYKKLIIISSILLSYIIITVILKNFINKYIPSYGSIEPFYGLDIKGNNKYNMNIIKNGSFLEGNHIESHHGTSKNNVIIAHSNPGLSSYVLRQVIDNNIYNSKNTQYTFAVSVANFIG